MTSSIFDLTETVNQIIDVERQSLDHRIRTNQRRESEISELTKIKSSIKEFQSALKTLTLNSSFTTRSATVSDSSVLSAKSGTNAAEGIYDITVNSLAQAARVESSATLFGNGREGTQTKLTGSEVNSSGDLNPNATINSGSMNLDSGKSISAGSFVINDQTITVSSSDTVNTILTRINNSNANVTAYYDTSTDKVIIEHNTIGSSQDIELGSDNTGFFDALKIDSAGRESLVDGSDADLYQNLEDTALSSINSGYLTINNRTIYVDPSTDSLSDVISRINSSGAGVSIYYDETIDKVTMISNVDGEDIEIKNDTSGVLAALNILDLGSDTDGTAGQSTYNGVAADVEVNGTSLSPDGNTFTINGTTFNLLSTGSSTVTVKADNDKFIGTVKTMTDKYNAMVGTINKAIDEVPGLKRSFERILRNIRTRLSGSIDNPGSFQYLGEIGLKFENGSTKATLNLNESELRTLLESDSTNVARIFSYDDDNDGLRDDGGIANSLRSYLNEFTFGSTGFIDKRKENLTNAVDREKSRISDKETYFDLRRENLLEQLIRTQESLQKLQRQFGNSQSIRVDFDLIAGKRL